MMIRHRLRRIGIVSVAILGLAPSACSHKAKPDGTPGQVTGSGTPATDQRIVDLMEKMRARALKAPGGKVEAADFAYNVSQLYTQGVTKRRQISPGLLDEAVKCLDEAKAANPDGAADLLARKGELLLAAGQTDAGVGALRESIADRPNLRAFKPLIKHYQAQKLAADAEGLCKRALPAMKSEDNSRYIVLDECLTASGAAKPEDGLRWAGAKEIGFYKARKREIEARSSAAAKAKEAAEAKK
jgi:tetratricopeptide (TPR) repeat protein